jgi:hypothetical protein
VLGALTPLSSSLPAIAVQRQTSERASAERPQSVSVRDEAGQARYVAEKILETRAWDILLRTQAVLFSCQEA